MNITIDEYFAMMQSNEGETTLNSIKTQLNKERFEKRFQGAGDSREKGWDNNVSALRNVSQEEYNSMRIIQASQLYKAYSENARTKLWIESTNNNKEDIRRVIGTHPGNVQHQGPVYIDQDTIDAINNFANFSRENSSFENGSWGNELTPNKLIQCIDEIIACKSLLEQGGKTEVTFQEIINNTNIAKRAIGKYVTGRNTFGIPDYQTTIQEVKTRNTGLFSKVRKGLKSLIGRINGKEEKILGDEEINLNLE